MKTKADEYREMAIKISRHLYYSKKMTEKIETHGLFSLIDPTH